MVLKVHALKKGRAMSAESGLQQRSMLFFHNNAEAMGQKGVCT